MSRLYWYRATDPAGTVATGTMLAQGVHHVEMQLARQQRFLIHARPARISGWATRSDVYRISRSEFRLFCFHMQQFSRAGIPVLDGLRELAGAAGGGAAERWATSLAVAVESGQTLSEAMERHTRCLDPGVGGLVRAGEASGQMATVFGQLFDVLSWQEDYMAKIAKSLLYPAILMASVSVAAGFLLFWLLPQLELFMQSLGASPPFVVRALVGVGAALQHHVGLLLLIGLAAVAPAAVPPVRMRIIARGERALLSVPGLGRALLGLATARSVHWLALMYQAGIPLLQALKLVRTAAGCAAVRRRLALMQDDLEAGLTFAASAGRSGLLKPMMQSVVRTGEVSGTLDEALLAVARIESGRALDTLTRLQMALEPTLTILLGIVLGGLMGAVLLPVYDLVASMQP